MATTPIADRAYRLLLAAAVVLALGLRLINIGAEPFWGDEALSFDVAHHFAGAPSQLFEYLKETEVHPPLYYLLLQAWTPIFGSSEASARFPSLLLSLGSVLAAAWLARLLFDDRRTAVFTAFLVAVLPLQVEYGHEARPYAFLGFLGVMAMASSWSYLKTGRRRWAVLFALVCALGFNLHYSFIFIFVPLALWWLFEALRAAPARRNRLLFDGVLACGAALLAFAWWLDAPIYRLMLGHEAISGLPGRFQDVGRAPEFMERTLVGLIWPTKQDTVPFIEIFAQTLFKVAALAAAIFCLRGAKRDTGSVPAWAFLGWTLFAALTLFLFSPFSRPYTMLPQEHVLFLSAVLAVVLGRLLAALPTGAALALSGILVATLLPRLADMVGNDAAWNRFYGLKAAAALIDDQARPGDLVLIAYANSRTNLDHYLKPSLEAVSLLPLAGGDLDTWRSRETLGFYEQEFQLRIGPTDMPGLIDKIDRLIQARHAPRVWIYGLTSDADAAVQAHFAQRDWRTVMSSIGDLSRLSLYAARR